MNFNGSVFNNNSCEGQFDYILNFMLTTNYNSKERYQG